MNTITIEALKMSYSLRGYAAKKAEKLRDDSGMSTIEYAFGSLAAAALAGVLYLVVNGSGVSSAIEDVITDALTNTPT